MTAPGPHLLTCSPARLSGHRPSAQPCGTGQRGFRTWVLPALHGTPWGRGQTVPPGAPGRSCLFRPIPSRHPALLRATAATRSSHHTGPLVHHGCLGSWCVPPPRAGSSLLGPLGRAVLCATSPTAAQPSCHPRMDDGLSQGEAQSPRENPSAPSVKDRCTRTGHKDTRTHIFFLTHAHTQTPMVQSTQIGRAHV